MSGSLSRHDEAFSAISDWLIDGALGDIDLAAQFVGLCDRLREAGIPLLRAHLATRSLHPMFVAEAVTWKLAGRAEVTRIPPGGDTTEAWRTSPLSSLLESGELEVRHRLDAGDAWRAYPLLVQLKERGASEYYAQVVRFGSSERARARLDGCILSWTSDEPGGFGDDQISVLRWIGSRFGLVAKLDRREQTAINVVSAYLGAGVGRRVLDGQIRLGDGEVIPAVIWYSDLRRSTALADSLSGEAFLGALNSYFQCTAGAVLDHGGEVLRFVGDAVLAIFHVDGVDGRTRAARIALAAARDAERRLAGVNAGRRDRGEEPLDFGLALHLGDLMFGNIGVPERIEFSVIGPAANEVARLESLTKQLGRRIVVSRVLADLLPLGWEALGEHRVAGVGKAISVYAPPPA